MWPASAVSGFYFGDEQVTSVLVSSEQGIYQLKFKAYVSHSPDPDTTADYRDISLWVASEALGGQSLVFHVCDELFRTAYSEKLGVMAVPAIR